MGALCVRMNSTGSGVKPRDLQRESYQGACGKLIGINHLTDVNPFILRPVQRQC